MKMRIPTNKDKDIDDTALSGLEISKMLTLCTGHISEKTADLITRESDENIMGLCVYTKASEGEKYGWFIYLNSNTEDKKHIPSDLLGCIELARDNGCSILCLDHDGPVYSDLPTFDWS